MFQIVNKKTKNKADGLRKAHQYDWLMTTQSGHQTCAIPAILSPDCVIALSWLKRCMIVSGARHRLTFTTSWGGSTFGIYVISSYIINRKFEPKKKNIFLSRIIHLYLCIYFVLFLTTFPRICNWTDSFYLTVSDISLGLKIACLT